MICITYLLINYSQEDFPTLVGAPAALPGSANWNKKAVQNNRPVTKTRSGPVRSNPARTQAPEPDYPALDKYERETIFYYKSD